MKRRAHPDPDVARDEARELAAGFEPERREDAVRLRRERLDAEDRLDAIMALPERWVY